MTDVQHLALASILNDLHTIWKPTSSQVDPLRKIFRDFKPFTFLECGRKYGKSEIFAYVLWRWALTKAGSYYYFAPFQKQAKEIVWASRRLQNFGPKKYLKKKPNDSEMRITLSGPAGESFIKVDGSDNFDAYRGVNPHGVVLDEFKDFRPEFWIAMEPNLATFEAQCLFAGTPPETDNEQFNAISEIAMMDSSYFNYPSWSNPHISRRWLIRKKKELYARNEGATWEREYGARRVFGGPGAIIPMFDRHKHIKPHDEIMEMIRKDRHKLLWIATADPGTATTFSVLFTVVNQYTQQVFHIDEIYITDQQDTTTSNIIKLLREKRDELYPSWQHNIDWIQVYDEAATWFCMEAMQSFDEPFTPTHKAQNKKEEGLSLIKDQCLKAKVLISDRCEKLPWEIENYIKDKNGKIPKERDHLIDCWRYANGAAGLKLSEDEEPVNKKRIDYRALRMQHDLEDYQEDQGINNIKETEFDFPDLEYNQ